MKRLLSTIIRKPYQPTIPFPINCISEPLTIEDVMHVIDLEQPLGVVVQFGGQTAINLADKLVARGVKVGTSLEDIDRTEDRHGEFEEMLHKLDIPQPQEKPLWRVEEAVKIANRIGYPVLVRPSYVLGDVRWKSCTTMMTCVSIWQRL